jgi:hypothetical protein
MGRDANANREGRKEGEKALSVCISDLETREKEKNGKNE